MVGPHEREQAACLREVGDHQVGAGHDEPRPLAGMQAVAADLVAGDAHGRAALDLMRLAPEVVALQDAPARVAILFSKCSEMWNPNYAGTAMNAYQALTFLGEKVDFITGQPTNGKGDMCWQCRLTEIVDTVRIQKACLSVAAWALAEQEQRKRGAPKPFQNPFDRWYEFAAKGETGPMGTSW